MSIKSYDTDEAAEPFPVLELVSDDLEFSTDFQTVLSEQSQLGGTDYNLVAIFGCQSSGKSTLLNGLFGTKFAVMDSHKGRHQTTRGIWLSKDTRSKTLVIDLEGCDSRERGEEKNTIERKFALFAVAVSEVLVVNMWHTDIGRHDAANYGLLRTVFDVHLQLFGKMKTRSLLLFVIRDYDQHTPETELARLLEGDMERMFDEIPKPSGLEDVTVHTYFDFELRTLPHFSYCRDEFKSSLAKLRDEFPVFIKPEYHEKIAHMPIDGFAEYTKEMWEVIDSNRDLDIPSQQILVATTKCEEAKTDVLNGIFAKLGTSRTEWSKRMAELTVDTKDFINKASDIHQDTIVLTIDPWYHLIDDVLETINDLLAEAVSEFSERVGRYTASVFEQHRSDLEHRLQGEMFPVLLDIYSKVEENMEINLSALNARVLNGFDFWLPKYANSPPKTDQVWKDKLDDLVELVSHDDWETRLDIETCGQLFGIPTDLSTTSCPVSVLNIEGSPSGLIYYKPGKNSFQGAGVGRSCQLFSDYLSTRLKEIGSKIKSLSYINPETQMSRALSKTADSAMEAKDMFDQTRKSECKGRMIGYIHMITNFALEAFRRQTVRIYRAPSLEMWNRISGIRNVCFAAAAKLSFHFCCEDAFWTEEVYAEEFARTLNESVLSDARSSAVPSLLMDSMYMLFHNMFSKGDDGLPRSWDPSVAIRPIYRDARSKTKEIYDRFKIAEFGPMPVIHNVSVPPPATTVLLDEEEADSIWSSLLSRFEKDYSEAVATQRERRRQSNIPLPFWLLMLFLGRRDIGNAIQNPIVLILIVGILSLFVLACFALGVSPSILGTHIRNRLPKLGLGTILRKLPRLNIPKTLQKDGGATSVNNSNPKPLKKSNAKKSD